MWNNTSITSLDLSRNNLSDFAGSTVARMLRRNGTLRKVGVGSASCGSPPVSDAPSRARSRSQLELDENELGPRACNAFGESLSSNSTLVRLSLESNPLTKDGEDSSGISAMARMLGANKTLTSLNLWRGGIKFDGCAELAQARSNPPSSPPPPAPTPPD